jgi:hypothetical protein
MCEDVLLFCFEAMALTAAILLILAPRSVKSAKNGCALFGAAGNVVEITAPVAAVKPHPTE